MTESSTAIHASKRPLAIRVLIAAVVTAMAIAFAPLVGATTAIVIGGNHMSTPGNSAMSKWLGGMFTQGYALKPITYPATAGVLNGWGSSTVNQSVAVGLDAMYHAVTTTDGKMIVTGTSQGTLVMDALQARLVTDPVAPASNRITFIYTAPLQHRSALTTSAMWYLGQGFHIPMVDWTVKRPVDSQYDTIIVVSEYDGWADFPDRPWNLVAVVNALMAPMFPRTMSVHGQTALTDLSTVPPENIVTTTNSKNATVTTVLVPTKNLPLWQPLRDMGVDSRIVDVLDQISRPIVDAGYVRNDRRTTPLRADLPTEIDPISVDAGQTRQELDAAEQESELDSERSNPTGADIRLSFRATPGGSSGAPTSHVGNRREQAPAVVGAPGSDPDDPDVSPDDAGGSAQLGADDPGQAGTDEEAENTPTTTQETETS